MFGAILGLAGSLLGARSQRRAEDRARGDALAAEQRQQQYNAQALADQRAYDEGVFARQRALALEDQQSQFVRLRQAAEAGGFNPLAILQANAGAGMPAQVSQGSGVPLAASAASIGYVPPTDYMGAAMADAGLLLADSFAKTRNAGVIGKLNAYQQQNNRLQRQVEKLTLRPTVPGVYDQRRQSGGGNAAGAGSSGRGGFSAQAAVGGGAVAGGIVPQQSHVVSEYFSNGQYSSVPRGPDTDEVITGSLIDANNARKARLAFENSYEARAGRSMRFPPMSRPSMSESDMIRRGWWSVSSRFPAARPRNADPYLLGVMQW